MSFFMGIYCFYYFSIKLNNDNYLYAEKQQLQNANLILYLNFNYQ